MSFHRFFSQLSCVAAPLGWLFAGALTVQSPQALALETGDHLPALSIESPGELVLQNQDVVYRPWQSSSLGAEINYIIYLGANYTSSKINQAISDRLEGRRYPEDKISTTAILNLDDALWGTQAFALMELKSNKHKYQHAHLVADRDGLGRKHWQLQPNSSAIILTDRQGKILFFKDGRLSAEEVDYLVDWLDRSGGYTERLSTSP